jgi:hypothetical protein
MSLSLGQAIQQSKQEWATNPRLRLGGYAIFALIWIYGLLLLRDYNKEVRSDWSRTESRIARAKNTSVSGEWSNRALDVKASVKDFEQLIWHEGSLGLAQAAAQEAVARSLLGAGIFQRSLRSAINEPTPATDGDGTSMPVPIRIRAQFEFKPNTLYPWLHAITRSVHEKKPALVIDSLVIRNAPNATVDVELVAYAARPDTAPAIARGQASAAQPGSAK